MILYRYLLFVILDIGLAMGLLNCTANSYVESTGQYIDNSAITAKIKATLFDELGTESFAIKVITYKEHVQLSGFVNSFWIKKKAEVIAYSIENVRTVKNDLIIKR